MVRQTLPWNQRPVQRGGVLHWAEGLLAGIKQRLRRALRCGGIREGRRGIAVLYPEHRGPVWICSRVLPTFCALHLPISLAFGNTGLPGVGGGSQHFSKCAGEYFRVCAMVRVFKRNVIVRMSCMMTSKFTTTATELMTQHVSSRPPEPTYSRRTTQVETYIKTCSLDWSLGFLKPQTSASTCKYSPTYLDSLYGTHTHTQTHTHTHTHTRTHARTHAHMQCVSWCSVVRLQGQGAVVCWRHLYIWR